MEIKLSDVERLMLSNQYQILDLLKPGQGYGEISEQLRNGHERLYSQIFDSFEPIFPRKDASHVYDVLDMYRALGNSRFQLPETDQADFAESDMVFPGYDGNNESDHLSFSHALAVNGKWQESFPDGVGINSHSQQIEVYERMLAVWRGMDKSFNLTKDQMKEILAASRHPES